METVELRPLNLGELLDRTFTLYRAHFWLFVGIMAIPAAFAIPFNAFYYSIRGSAGSKFSPGMVGGLVLMLLVFLVILSVAYAAAMGAVTYAISETYLGQAATIRDSYSKVRRNLGRIVGVTLNVWLRLFGIGIIGTTVAVMLTALIASGGRFEADNPAVAIVMGTLIALVYASLLVFFVLWSLRYAVSIPSLLLEKLGISASIKRSVQLTAGRKWQLLVAVVLTVIVTYVGVIVFQGPFLVMMFLAAKGGQLPGWLTFASAISGAIGGALTGPLLMIVLVLYYYDARIRKEGFDLQFMMSSLRPVPAPGTALPG